MAIDLSPPPDGAGPDEVERAFWRNAHFLAVASNLAYLPDTGDDQGVQAQFQAQLQADGAVLLPQDAGEAPVHFVVAESGTDIVVAFRGSTDLLGGDLPGIIKDWLMMDAQIKLHAPEDGEAEWRALGVDAMFHTGFFRAIRAVQDLVLSEVQKRVSARPRPVWLTGHSLGGAVAHLAAFYLDNQGTGLDLSRVVTFAAPMAMNAAAADQYDRFLRTRVFRYVNVSDLVPKLPILDLLRNPYRHVGQRIDLAAEDQSPVAADDWLGRIRALAEPLLGQLNKAVLRGLLLQFVVTTVNAHSLTKGYLSRIEAWRRAHGDSVP
jgi:hypothetical protein